jgi:regulator of protease activity HflC (stomatin/prohibitin superfamily)
MSDQEPSDVNLLPAWAKDPVPRRDRSVEICVTLILCVLLAPHMFFTVHAGQVGVVFHRLGHGTAAGPSDEQGEGLHVIAPWDLVQIYELRIQQSSIDVQVLSHEGLSIRLKGSILYRPIKEEIGLLHKEIGPDYLDRVIKPEVESRLRVLASRRNAEEIYVSQRDLQEDASAVASEALAGRHMRVENVLIQEVSLPVTVQHAIDEKQQQAQLSIEYDWRLVQEEKEAKRKEIEAQGIRGFQSIAGEGLTDAYLRWRNIEATLALAKSNNAKVVVMSGGTGAPPPLLVSPGAGDPPEAAPPVSSSSPAPARP